MLTKVSKTEFILNRDHAEKVRQQNIPIGRVAFDIAHVTSAR